MSAKDPKPEIMRLEEVALLVKSGEIKLPRFQRPFVWLKSDMLKLLDSIYKGYPIGSILIWNSSQRLTSERSIAGLEVDEKQQGWFPTNYLLDGQQRLTTLCGALFWKGDQAGSIWDINFDLEREEFLYPKDPNLVSLFPLNKLINTGDFIRQCMKFEHHPKKLRYIDLAEKLLRVIKDYKIAVVKIGDMTIEEVAPIFERINSTGRKLTIVDLMMAATWSNGFDLTLEIKNIKGQCSAEGFEEISDQIILRSIAAAAELGINKDDIQRLRAQDPEDLLVATYKAGSALSCAIRFLRDFIGLHDLGYLPYGLQLTHLAEFFRLCPEPSEEKQEELRKWFWFTSASRYFGGANTGQNTKDLALIRAFGSGRVNSLFDRNELDISSLLYDRFNLRNATSTTFALLLNYLHPKSTVDGKPLDEAHLKLKSSRFFGSVVLPPYDRLNVSRVIYPFPSNTISANATNGSLSDHLLDEACTTALNSGNSAEFVEARSLLVSNLISRLSSCKAVYQAFQGVAQIPEESELSYDEDL